MGAVLSEVFNEMAAILLLYAVIGIKLKQSLIVAFGIIVGPSVLNWVSSNDKVDLIAKLSIAILLFLVGFKLDLHIIKTLDPVALSAGISQMVFTWVFGFLIALALGMDTISAIYFSVALTFSKIIIIVKLLSDKRELDQLHDKIVIGFLIV